MHRLWGVGIILSLLLATLQEAREGICGYALFLPRLEVQKQTALSEDLNPSHLHPSHLAVSLR